MTVNKNELRLVLEKLDNVKLELLRLRAMLLPEEEASEEEKQEIKAAWKEIANLLSLQEPQRNPQMKLINEPGSVNSKD